MANRRKVLIGLGGLVAIAGCSGEDPEYEEGETPEEEEESQEEEEEESQEEEEEESQEEEEEESQEEDSNTDEGEAYFEVKDPTTDGETFSEGDEVPIGAYVENTGDSTGEQTVQLLFDGELYTEDDFELEPGEETDVGLIFDAEEFSAGSGQYTIRSEDDEVTASYTIEEPEPEPSEEDIEIVEHEMIIDEGEFSDEIYVEGIVSNNADTMASYVEVTVRVYDSGGNQLDSYIDNTTDLAADTTWAFEVMILEDADDVDDYDIAVEDIRF